MTSVFVMRAWGQDIGQSSADREQVVPRVLWQSFVSQRAPNLAESLVSTFERVEWRQDTIFAKGGPRAASVESPTKATV
jgi:hypothetical protein